MRVLWTVLITIILLSTIANAQTPENLDEMFARKARRATATFPVSQLENASNYIWQPETFMYKDIQTGHEVWKMSNTPRSTYTMYNNDIGVSPWSADGKKLALVGYNRPDLIGTGRLWMTVDTNGGHFRTTVEGAGRTYGSTNAYFHWSPQIPDTYYEMGGGYRNLYKTYVSDTSVSPSLLLTFPETVKIDKMISGDGRKLLISSTLEATVYPTTIEPTASINDPDGYSVDRHLGLYGDMVASYSDVHDRYYAGDGTWYFILPSGGAHGWWRLKDLGSAPDGGALYDNTGFPVTDPNHDFGETWPENFVGGTNPSPLSPYYWSHFLPDRWGRFAMYSNGDADPIGPAIWDMQKHQHSVVTFGGGAQHHDWHGFTDWTVSSSGASVNAKVYAQKYNDSNSQITVCSTYTSYDGGALYQTLVRPGQSPDGTKVSWHSEFLNGADVVDTFWSVVYYPYPPTDLSASYSSGVRISWLPPKYTDRGWPYASASPQKDSLGWPLLDASGKEIGEPLYAREIKQYHVWRSASPSGPWQEVGTTQAQYSYTYAEDPNMLMLHPIANGLKVSETNKIYFTDNPGDGTYYYALTSEEHSGLESDELSEILRVTVSGTSVSSSVVQAKGQQDFWTADPQSPANFQSATTGTPGQFRLSWTEPYDSKIRFYNIYYSNLANLQAVQGQRIASIPKGQSAYLDWLADSSSTGYYGITSVDRYGNEGVIVLQNEGPPPPCTDLDGDGYGSPASSLCTYPQLDCNDANSSIHPGATEICSNGIDEDCSGADLMCSTCPQGQITSRCLCGGSPYQTGYCCSGAWQSGACAPPPACTDIDSDGYGSPASSSCTYPTLDCNDSNPSIHPGAAETCGDGIDYDCDGYDSNGYNLGAQCGGGNIALNKNVTASRSDWGTQASWMVDGIRNGQFQYWSAQGVPNWLTVDLGSDNLINSINIGPYGFTGSGCNYVDAWNLMYRNYSDSVWRNFTGVIKQAGAGSLATSGISITNGRPASTTCSISYTNYNFTFTAVSARYVRYEATRGDQDGDTNGDEIEVYGGGSGTIVCSGLYATICSSCHKSDSDCSGCVSNLELSAFIDRWKVDSSNPTIKELIEAIGLWKRGGC